MVGVEVGEEEQRDLVDAEVGQAAVGFRGVGAGVDDDGRARADGEGEGVALADVFPVNSAGVAARPCRVRSDLAL
ncbi:hypothetical protein GCM10009838_21020 [Catenulispora subtropica]|uniref:Uncharacterized protein n=1 Tax=Catenulispora subtropica TaxID=450798 RepID=A0ABN2R5I0_9ACTN